MIVIGIVVSLGLPLPILVLVRVSWGATDVPVGART
jgi:hypothetical protein